MSTTPQDGEVIEDFGVFYKYSASLRSWNRMAGCIVSLADEETDGLMSADDLAKLTGLIIPPPSINLSFEGCSDTFKEGYLLISGSDIISIKVGNSFHENTAAINFNIDTENLVQKMVADGKLKLTAPRGTKGIQGKDGKDGANAVPVGPYGKDGTDGQHAQWNGELRPEVFNVEQQDLSVVDIDIESDSTGNYLVVSRAALGGDNCPDTILPQNVYSPWILAFDSTGSYSPDPTSSDPAIRCGWGCSGQIYYFDVEALVQSIHSHWLSYLNYLRNEKVKLANSWLSSMMNEYNSQKASLCCSLEACRSRYRNQDARRYIEQQRIAAANSDLRLIIGGIGDRIYPPGTNNKWNIPPTDNNPLHLPDAMQSSLVKNAAYGSIWRIPTLQSAADIPDVDVKVSRGPVDAAGRYSGNIVVDNDEFVQYAWHKGEWILEVFKCKTDNKYCARLYNINSDISDGSFGGNQNVTSCFLAGELIDIISIESGSFMLHGGGSMSRASVLISIV